MGEDAFKFDEIKIYVGDQCIGSAKNIKIEKKYEVAEKFKPSFLPCEISGTLKITKVSQRFRNMLKRQRNILKARRLDAIMKKTRKDRIKKKLVRRICKLI